MQAETISGVVFNIQRFSLHDGAGIRTLVFTKGCPLRCRWCSNPEGFTPRRQVLDNPTKCIGCAACLKVCPEKAVLAQEGFPIERSRCTGCGACAKHCPTGAKSITGEYKTVDEILEIVERDSPFYTHSDGGVTMGGGEILQQPVFTYEILRRCREKGIGTAIETSGYGDWAWLEKLADVSDIIHYDIKALEPELHKALTGVDNRLILDNLRALDKKVAGMTPRPQLILRLPLIEGFNATEDNIIRTIEFIKRNLTGYTKIELLPFHNFGEQKYKKLGIPYELAERKNMNPEALTGFTALFAQEGIPVTVSKW